MKRSQFRGNTNAGIGPVKTANAVYTCGRCAMFYYDYKLLVEHLYWRHGTESLWCKLCGLKKWRYAAHVCNILPIDDEMYVQFAVEDILNIGYCFCGEDVADVPMIGCDSPQCTVQWFHFKCVGIDSPPDGDWFCPLCQKLRSDEIRIKPKQDGAET